MKKLTWFVISCLLLAGIPASGCDSSQSTRISFTGAGASFPYPIYSYWAYIYEEVTGVEINYQAIGSGGGISVIKGGQVDFGASDKPLEIDELDEDGLIQFPMLIGGVVPVVNVPGIGPGELRLSGDTLARLFLGEITNWSDQEILVFNTEMELPDLDVTVVHRADGSGTTWIFSNYLDKVSSVWGNRVGVGKSLDWPVGLGANKNEGVAQNVMTVPGSIGYVEYAYAHENDMTYCALQNRNGRFVTPTIESFKAAAANADWGNAPGYYMVLVDQPGDESWPITGASFILIEKDQDDYDKARGMLEFFDWCFTHGQDRAIELDYVPIPENVVEMIENTWADEITVGGEVVWE